MKGERALRAHLAAHPGLDDPPGMYVEHDPDGGPLRSETYCPTCARRILKRVHARPSRNDWTGGPDSEAKDHAANCHHCHLPVQQVLTDDAISDDCAAFDAVSDDELRRVPGRDIDRLLDARCPDLLGHAERIAARYLALQGNLTS